jgi:hypothetical protein
VTGSSDQNLRPDAARYETHSRSRPLARGTQRARPVNVFPLVRSLNSCDVRTSMSGWSVSVSGRPEGGERLVTPPGSHTGPGERAALDGAGDLLPDVLDRTGVRVAAVCARIAHGGRCCTVGSLRRIAGARSVRSEQALLLVAMGAGAALVALLYFMLFG